MSLPNMSSGASVTGTVIGPNGSPLSGATVQMRSDGDNSHSYTARTDSEGRYTVRHVPPGSYFIFAQRAADLLGVDDRGVIAEGKRADLVAVPGNPLEDITVIGGTDKWWDVIFTPHYTASFLVDELGQQQGGQSLAVRGDHVHRVAIYWLATTEFADPESAREHDLAVLHDTNRCAGHAGHFETTLDEPCQLGQAVFIQLVGLFSCKRFAFETFRQKAAQHQVDCSPPFAADVICHVVDPDRPHLVSEHRAGDNEALLIR